MRFMTVLVEFIGELIAVLPQLSQLDGVVVTLGAVCESLGDTDFASLRVDDKPPLIDHLRVNIPRVTTPECNMQKY